MAAASVAAVAAALWYTNRAPVPRWEVTGVQGAPTIGSNPLRGAGHLVEGEWLETDAISSARIKVGAIGTIDGAPNTRLRLTTARANEHRLALERGDISASVNAPPRLFFVDTPSSTAIDLGCAYTMHMDEHGNGLLHVTLGWVALEWAGRVSEVPGTAYCQMRKGVGPGTPYFDDASGRLREALDEFDFGKSVPDVVDTVMSEARLKDTLTLWHLLARVDPGQRVRVYERIVALAGSPSGITKEKTLSLDPATLKRWGDALVEK